MGVDVDAVRVSQTTAFPQQSIWSPQLQWAFEILVDEKNSRSPTAMGKNNDEHELVEAWDGFLGV